MNLAWKDLGLVFNVEELNYKPSWYVSHAQAPNAVVFEDFVRVYFTGRGSKEKDGNFISRAMFVDMDPSANFEILALSERPILDLGNIGEFDEHGTYPFSVLKKDGDFIAVYGGWSRSKSVPFDISLGLAFSDTGTIFKKVGRGPILSPKLNEPFVITSPKLRYLNGKYVLTYTAGTQWLEYKGRKEIVYKLRIAFSQNLIDWERSGINIIQDKLGDLEAQACGDIYSNDIGHHMFFCYREALDFRDNAKNSYKLGYAFSTNLENWVRNDSILNINSKSNSWDSNMQAYPNVFEFKGKTYILYLGNDTGVSGFGAQELIKGKI